MIWGTKLFGNFLAKNLVGIPVKLDKQRCKSLKEYCGQPCLAKCPQGALELELGNIRQESCISCGSCAAVCPISAPGFADITDFQVVDKIGSAVESGKQIKFVCQNWQDTNGAHNWEFAKVKVACLSRLYPGMLLMPIAFGAQNVLVDTSSCGKCSYNRDDILASTIAANVVEAVQWVELLGHEANISTGAIAVPQGLVEGAEQTQESAGGGGLKRRELFKLLNQELKANSTNLINEIMISVVEKIKQYQESEQGKREVPLKKYITSLAINNILKDQGTDRELINQYLPEVAQGCTLCQICSKICPTGALKQELDQRGQQGTISYQSAYCISCSGCASKCPEQVLSFTKPMSVRDLVSTESKTIFQQELAACSRCKGHYVKHLGQDSLCHICYEKELKRLDLQLNFN